MGGGWAPGLDLVTELAVKKVVGSLTPPGQVA